jgi:hypothetical protein
MLEGTSGRYKWVKNTADNKRITSDVKTRSRASHERPFTNNRRLIVVSSIKNDILPNWKTLLLNFEDCIDGFYNKSANKMKSPVIKLLQKAFSDFSLFEFILPLTSLIIGQGIVHRASIKVNVDQLIQMILFLAFLEIGSQLLIFYQKEFSHSFTRIINQDEKNAALILVILFFGLSILPLSQVFLDSRSGTSFSILLAMASFLIIIWRTFGKSPIHQILSIFIFSFNISFFVPLIQLAFNGLNANILFVTISQILFLFLFGYLMIREVFQIEINHEQSRIVQIIGSIPILKMAEVILFLGSVLLVTYSIKNPEVEIIIFTSISVGLFLISLHQTFHLDREGKPGLITIYRATTLLLVTQFLGWSYILWII